MIKEEGLSGEAAAFLDVCSVSVVVENGEDKGVALSVDENGSRTVGPLGNREFPEDPPEASKLSDSSITGV